MNSETIIIKDFINFISHWIQGFFFQAFHLHQATSFTLATARCQACVRLSSWRWVWPGMTISSAWWQVLQEGQRSRPRQHWWDLANRFPVMRLFYHLIHDLIISLVWLLLSCLFINFSQLCRNNLFAIMSLFSFINDKFYCL